MKKTILLFVGLFISLMGFSQQNEGFNYKALLTDNGNPVANQNIDVKVSIYYFSILPSPSTTLVWQEEHTAIPTDANGIFNIFVGEGTRIGGTATNFSDISWATSVSRYKISVDVKWGSNTYQNLVNQEVLEAVPLAKHANSAYKLDTQYGQIVFANTSDGLKFNSNSAGSNRYEIKLDGTHLGFLYNGGAAMDIIGSGLVNVNNQINVNGKLTAPASGDADMKAYIYGLVKSDGTFFSAGSSDGFTITKTGTGSYKIQFTSSGLTYGNYMALATLRYGNTGFISVNLYSSYFVVKTLNASGTASDLPFTFVVYKK